MASLSGVFNLQNFDALGNMAAGGRLYTYAPGTTTHKTAYTDAAGTIAHTYTNDGAGGQYIAMDARGELPAPLFLSSGGYDITYKSSAGVTVWTRRAGSSDDAAAAFDTAIRADFASTADAAKGDALVGVKRSATNAVGDSLNDWIEAIDGYNPVGEFAALKDGSDQTAAVQLAVTACGARGGGTVIIPKGCKFNLKTLTFPQRCNLEFWLDDDLSRPNPLTVLGTNERILYQSNANNDGIVNEHRFTGSFHPAVGVDVRRDVPGHDAHLGPSQERVPDASTPARASYNIFDQQVDTWRCIYEIFGGDYSNFTGVRLHTWYRTVTLTGIGSGNFSATPAVGQLFTGTVSGARGWYISSNSTTTTLLWLDGKFATGESITATGITAATTVTLVTFDAVAMPAIAQDFRKGFVSVGLPAGSPAEQFAVGGRIGVSRTRSAGQHIQEEVLNPGYVWVDSYEGSPPNGFQVVYDTGVAAASRRLYKRKYGESLNRQVVGSLHAAVVFNDGMSVSSKAHNIASVTKVGTGWYRITFFNSFASADYAVTITPSQIADRFQVVNAKTSTYCDITNYDSSGTAANLTSQIDVCVFLGDI